MPDHFKYGVYCRGGGIGEAPCDPPIVELSEDEYTRQLDRPNHGWECPRCGGAADWDDDSTCMDELAQFVDPEARGVSRDPWRTLGYAYLDANRECVLTGRDDPDAVGLRFLEETYLHRPRPFISVPLIDRSAPIPVETLKDVREILRDSNNVHSLMLKGVIAKLSWRQMAHISGEVPNRDEAQLSEIVKLREELAAMTARHDRLDRQLQIQRALQAPWEPQDNDAKNFDSIHNKTGDRYISLRQARDCTNARDGTDVVIYRKVGSRDLFVREVGEFEEKFRTATPEERSA